MAELALSAKPRSETGKGYNRRLRAAGRIPATLYGADQETVSISLLNRDLEDVLHQEGAHRVIALELEGAKSAKQSVMFRMIQRHPVHEHMIHADFIRILDDKEIHVTLDVLGQGVPEGVRSGGMLNRQAREIAICCLPKDLPSKIEVDISALTMDDVLRAGDLTLPEGVVLESDPATPLFGVVAMRVVEEEVTTDEDAEGAEEAAEGAEPALVDKKKESEDSE